jgi:hypothetical protein
MCASTEFEIERIGLGRSCRPRTKSKDLCAELTTVLLIVDDDIYTCQFGPPYLIWYLR